jgi:hypothetical protein
MLCVEGANAVEEFEEVQVQAFDLPVMYTAYEEKETCCIADNWFSK